MKVAITVPWGERAGGAETMLWTFLRHVDRTRVEPIVVFLQPGAFADEVSALGFRTHVVQAGRLRQAGRFASAVRAVATLIGGSADAVLNWTAKSQVYGGAAAVLARMSARTVWWQHGIPDGHWLDRIATTMPAAVVACSSRACADAQASLRPRRRTVVIHPGVEAAANGDESSRRLIRGSNEQTIGIVARLQPWKHQDRFIRTVAELRRRGRPVRGVVVGGDSHGLSPGYEASLHRLSRDLGVDPYVEFTGHVTDPARYVADLDLVVSAATKEPFGIGLLEAMAAGVPVVAVARGGPVEIVEHGTSGVLVEGEDERALADAIEPVLADPVLRETLAEAARARVRARFSADSMARRIETLLEEVAGS